MHAWPATEADAQDGLCHDILVTFRYIIIGKPFSPLDGKLETEYIRIYKQFTGLAPIHVIIVGFHPCNYSWISPLGHDLLYTCFLSPEMPLNHVGRRLLLLFILH